MKEIVDEKTHKLIYVLKIGYNSKDEGMYEFVFSNDETNVDIETWCWDLPPASQHAQPPTEDYISKVVNLKTGKFDLECLHESYNFPYVFGYHTIQALAYETKRESDDGYEQYDNMMNGTDDLPLLVFHYGMTLAKVKEILNVRKIILKNNEFIETSSVKFD